MRRRLITGVLLLVVAAWFAGGEWLSAPSRSRIGPPPPDLQAESIVIDGATDESLDGWYARGVPGRGAVLPLHGIRGDRRQMLGRARFLHADGYAVLLIDLPAHGESAGRRTTFGHHEAEAVEEAMCVLREASPNERTAIIGVSLGAAATVMASGHMPPPDAVVLESTYLTITEAVADRLTLHFGDAAAGLTPLLLWQ